MRRSALAVALFLIVSLAAAAPAGASLTITVTPSTHLHSLGIVVVSGTGFSSGAALVAAECTSATLVSEDCDTANAAFITADAAGAFAFSLRVHGDINTSGGVVACSARAGACNITVADMLDVIGTSVSGPLSFAAPPPPQAGVLHAPAAPVVPAFGVTITATDFVPGALIETDLCAAHPAGMNDCSAPWPVTADRSGSLSFVSVPGPLLHTKNGRSINCTVDGACIFAAWDYRDFATLTTAAVRLAPKIAGSFTVKRSTNLRDGQKVTLSGSGWPAQIYINLDECDGPSTDATCINPSAAFTGDNGVFSKRFTVQRVSHDPEVNCETGPCWIVATWFAPGSVVSTARAISFAPIPVTSHYTSTELTAIRGAATSLGVSNTEVQRLGAWALAWVLDLSHTGAITPVPDSGPGTLTTRWQPSEYSVMNAAAASHTTTLAEFQKTGALFLAYVLALP